MDEEVLPLPVAARYLELLQVREEDRAAILNARKAVDEDPILSRVFSHAYLFLLESLGRPVPVEGPSSLPRLRHASPAARWVYIWSMLAALPHVRSYHRALGIPDDVSLRSLRRLGGSVRRRAALRGLDGARHETGLPLVFQGVSFVFGRLAFDRTTVWFDDTDDLGESCRRGEPGLKLHVPADGTLDPDECEDAFRQAAAFFAEHFGLDSPVFISRSWLLDPQLNSYLPTTSNICRYQSRFTRIPTTSEASEVADGTPAILEYVFDLYGGGGTPMTLDLRSRRGETTLTRAVREHFASGRKFAVRTGWFRRS